MLADEDVEEDPDRWCSHTECGQELWQIACQPCPFRDGCGICACPSGRPCRESNSATSSGPRPQKPRPCSKLQTLPHQSTAPGSWPPHADEPRDASGLKTRVLQEDGKLRCPAGASLWLSEVRQEHEFTQRAVYLAYQTDCQRCARRAQCLASGAKGDRARRASAVRRLLPPPVPLAVERKPVLLGPIRWVDVAGRALRRRWMTHWRRQYVEILPLTDKPPSLSPLLRPPRALRSHHRWSWNDRLACNAWAGPAKPRITLAGVAACLANHETGGTGTHTHQHVRSRVFSPLNWS